MKNNYKKAALLIFILPLFLIAGCITKKAIPEGGEPEFFRPPALSDETIEKRISHIKNLIEQNILSDERKETAFSILKAYDKLKSFNKENSTEKEYRKTVQLLFNNLVNIEQLYLNNVEISDDSAGETIIENYSVLKREIFEDYFAGNFKGVISGCDDLISRFGTKGLTPDLGIVLVESLSKSNMVSEALAVSRSILDAVERRPDLIRFLVDGVELEMKMGNMENARRLYEKLIDNINERNSLFKKAGDLISENKDNGTAVDDAIKDKLMDIAPEKSIQLRQLADTVEELLSQKDFSGARLELVRHRLRAEEGPELEMIEQLLKGVDKAEEQFETGNSNDRMVIDDARRLIEEEKYLQALDILEPLVAAGINYEAEKLKREAVEKYINSEKLLAANLKRESNKVIEITRKRELLIKAKSIFQNLIEKFPESPLIDRVKRNISVIDEELVDLSSHSD